MIQEMYILDRETLSLKTVFIEPEDEWFYILNNYGKDRIKAYNDIDPDTKQRTGRFYLADDVFSTREDGLEGLCGFIKAKMECNLANISALQQKNEQLSKLLVELEV